MRFKEQRAIQRGRKNPGHFITRLFLKGRPGKKKSVCNVHSCCTFKLAIFIIEGSKFRLNYFAHKFCMGLSTTNSLLLSLFCVQFLSTKFFHARLSEGVLHCLTDWKEMNSVFFLWMLLFFCLSKWLIFWEQSYELMKELTYCQMNQKFLPRNKWSSQVKLTGVKSLE